MSSSAYHSWLIAAGIVDGLSIFLPVGPLFISIARLDFSINGYAGGAMVGRTITTAIVEMVPVASTLPSCMFFVWSFYQKNKTATETISQKTTSN